MERNLIKLEDVINLLVEEEYLMSNDEIPITKPTHGPCCTCQKCGYPHDECVCYHNHLLRKLKNLKRFSCIDFDQVMD